jgi:CheY-like chemotaxis protein
MFIVFLVSANATISPVTDEVRSATPLFQSMAQAGTVRIAVKDSGAGLSPQQLAEICAEGVQFNANELQAGQGSGLGLFISKGIIEQHGGRLVVESEGLGKGVTFTVELPLFRFDWHSKPNRASLRSMQSRGSRDFSVASEAALLSIAGDLEHHEHTIKTGAHCGPQRLLVVDDSVFNRKMMVRLLVTQDHTCEQAEDGAAAVRKYLEMVERGEPPDAILMDYEMPVMNGPSATARLREIGCACLILGVTGNVLPAEVSIFREHGADDVLAKPLVLETLTTLLMAGRATPIAAFTECTKPSASVQQHPHDKVLPFEIV